MGLSEIRELLESPDYDAALALERHLKTLRVRQRELEALVETVEMTIATMKGQQTMTNEERFRGLKEQAIETNENAYGAEARERYGDDAVNAANERVRAMSEKDWNEMRKLEQGIIRQLKAAMATGDPAGDAAQELVVLHRRWICGYWGEGRYSAPGTPGAWRDGTSRTRGSATTTTRVRAWGQQSSSWRRFARSWAMVDLRWSRFARKGRG